MHYGCRKERKELDKERKARRNKNFGLIEEAKGLWEELRRHDLSAAKRAKLVTSILAKCQGRLAELAGSHSASRIIQSCAKYGSAAERAAILKELQPKLLELAKSPYGHFVVSKLVALAPKEQLPGAQQPPALPCTTETPSFLRPPPPSPLWLSSQLHVHPLTRQNGTNSTCCCVVLAAPRPCRPAQGLPRPPGRAAAPPGGLPRRGRLVRG